MLGFYVQNTDSVKLSVARDWQIENDHLLMGLSAQSESNYLFLVWKINQSQNKNKKLGMQFLRLLVCSYVHGKGLNGVDKKNLVMEYPTTWLHTGNILSQIISPNVLLFSLDLLTLSPGSPLCMHTDFFYFFLEIPPSYRAKHVTVAVTMQWVSDCKWLMQQWTSQVLHIGHYYSLYWKEHYYPFLMMHSSSESVQE